MTVGDPVRSSDHCVHVNVIYLFAGKQRKADIGEFLKAAEQRGLVKLQLKEFDIERQADHDLTNQDLWSEIFTLIESGNWVVIVSPPCNTFSRARFQFLKHPGPKPVRNRTWPRGFPWLSGRDRVAVDEANFFVTKSIEAASKSLQHGGHFLLEHPEDLGQVQGECPGTIWQWDEVLDLLTFPGVITFAIHQCMFGGQTPKPTRFMTSLPVDDKRCFMKLPRFDKAGLYLGPLPRDCGHTHSEKLIGKSEKGWRTSPSAAYPAGLCEFLANQILSAQTACGRGSKNLSAKRKASTLNVGVGASTCNISSTDIVATDIVAVDGGVPPSNDDVGSGALSSSSNSALDNSISDNAMCSSLSVGCGVDDDSFDVSRCKNFGPPMMVEWAGVHRPFVDGFGLCSPTRWPPASRGLDRGDSMKRLADATYNILLEAVVSSIRDVRMEAFRLVTGKISVSPFTKEKLDEVRKRWAALLPCPKDALMVDDGQPFLLRGLALWLKAFDDPDTDILVDGTDNFASGVWVGVDKPLPRCPQVFPPKLKHRKLDETEFNPVASNYPSAQLSSAQLEEKFREEEKLGRMFPSTLPVTVGKYGSSRVRVASMAAIMKPDGGVRPLHDATHSVMVNHEIKYADQLQCPGPAEVAASVREAALTFEAPFCVSADIQSAHRSVKVREADWGYLACKSDSNSSVLWLNRVGTFGVSSAPYWWARLMALIGRFVGHLMGTHWFLQMVYVDDLHGVFIGERKFLHLWIWILAFELVGTPFGYHKFKGGLVSNFVGFHLRYDLCQVGISDKRGEWLCGWVDQVSSKNFVVATRDFSEFLGRLGFVSQLLTWMKPHLAPLYSWAAAMAPGTVGRLPETVILTILYIASELRRKSFLVSAKVPGQFGSEVFRTDAKCTDVEVVIAGWECGSDDPRWFAISIDETMAPFLFKPGKGAQWSSTSSELLATLAAMKAFDWAEESLSRKSVGLSIFAGTDNKGNEGLTSKRSTTKWPLMIINMQLSSVLSRAKIDLHLNWRPRDENKLADALTNGDYSGVSPGRRVNLSFEDIPLDVVNKLWLTKVAFDEARSSPHVTGTTATSSRKFDKSPW